MEWGWFEKLPNWVKGTIGFFTAVITFIVLFLDNVYLSITILVIFVLIYGFIFSIYVFYGQKKSDFRAGTTVNRFPEKYRMWAHSSMIIIPLIAIFLIATEKTRTFASVAFNGTVTPSITATSIPTETLDLTKTLLATLEPIQT